VVAVCVKKPMKWGNWLRVAGCFFCMIGVKRYRRVVIPTVLLLFLADGITKGFNGFVNHAELGILYASLILAIFPTGDGFSLFKNGSARQKPDAYYSVPILAIAFTLCLAYTFVGVHRLLYGGMEQFTNHAMEIHLLRNSLEYSKWGFDLGLFVVSSEPLLILFKAGFFAITLFEVFSLYALVNRTFLYIWLAVMVPFHLLSLFTMNIFFWENLILILVLFLVIGRGLNR
jgi:hypothetical protein